MTCKVRKHTFVHVRQGKILISLQIHTVGSVFSLGALGIAKDAKYLHADTED